MGRRADGGLGETERNGARTAGLETVQFPGTWLADGHEIIGGEANPVL